MSSDERLPDEALVVRCGLPPYGRPTWLPTRCVHYRGVYGFSVQTAADVTLETLASWCLNGQIGVTTVAQIRQLGYDVVVTPGRGYHATVIVPTDWEQADAELLVAIFRATKNPNPGSEQ